MTSIQDGWPSSVEWSQAENRQCLYSYTGVCFLQWESQEKLRHFGQLQKVAASESLFNILAILDSISPVDVYVIFVEVVHKMARKYNINGETPTWCFFILARVFSPTTLKWYPRSLFFHWMYKMKYSCFQDSSVIHGWFVNWVFGWEMRRLWKSEIRFWTTTFSFLTLLDV